MAVYHVSNGQVSGGIVLNGNDGLSVSSGGTANHTTVHSGGELYVSRGGKVTGALQISEGAFVSVYEGAEIDSDLSGRKTTDAALINDLSLSWRERPISP